MRAAKRVAPCSRQLEDLSSPRSVAPEAHGARLQRLTLVQDKCITAWWSGTRSNRALTEATDGEECKALTAVCEVDETGYDRDLAQSAEYMTLIIHTYGGRSTLHPDG